MSVVEVDAGATSTASVQVTLLAVGTPDEISFSWLSQDERERAARYTRPEAGRSFMIRRALLRRTLALALDANPADIRFEVDEMGKPHLASHPDHEFSFSHAGAFALIALGRLRLGVDIESLDNILDQPTLATRVLTRRELAIYDAQSPAARPRMLLEALVRKEALVRRWEWVCVGTRPRSTSGATTRPTCPCWSIPTQPSGLVRQSPRRTGTRLRWLSRERA
jgi:4'-phosphopantetheinyl transferase